MILLKPNLKSRHFMLGIFMAEWKFQSIEVMMKHVIISRNSNNIQIKQDPSNKKKTYKSPL